MFLISAFTCIGSMLGVGVGSTTGCILVAFLNVAWPFVLVACEMSMRPDIWRHPGAGKFSALLLVPSLVITLVLSLLCIFGGSWSCYLAFVIDGVWVCLSVRLLKAYEGEKDPVVDEASSNDGGPGGGRRERKQ